MRKLKQVNEGKVIAAFMFINAPIAIVLVFLNAYIWQSQSFRYLMLGYSIGILAVTIIQFIVANINCTLARKEADRILDEMVASVKKAREKTERLNDKLNDTERLEDNND